MFTVNNKDTRTLTLTFLILNSFHTLLLCLCYELWTGNSLLERMISQIKPLRIKYFLPFNFEITTICVAIRLTEDRICKVITLSKSLESVKQLAAWQLLLIIYKKTDEWYIEWHSVTMSHNEWQWVVVSVNFLFFFFFERHSKER